MRRQLIYEVCDFIDRLFLYHFIGDNDSEWHAWSIMFAEDIGIQHFAYETRATTIQQTKYRPYYDMMDSMVIFWQKLLDTDDVVHESEIVRYASTFRPDKRTCNSRSRDGQACEKGGEDDR